MLDYACQREKPAHGGLFNSVEPGSSLEVA
jgi:hypothetical protein